MRAKISMVFVCGCFMLALGAGSALAETPAQDAYSTSPSTVSQGSLPFTGLSLGIVVVAGVLLLGTGVAVRRATRLRQH